ncbi:tRNA uridine-5-carboxymethylaminomethyl(34) synthesis GTPase MnmE [Parvularcula sp. IMCC14364]|uniref:tRNA uridine-5-carboxymethylaminomethyl(34) synthesis GTPase MnmE n=1 Tax=Parvularcula sp. IMCC14364 TaxID=3067902 RepID=UPI002741A85A|nr:tRNA uridine-5-carboxymethylaminomethyl(34) synthesis GTPase MnmE [Parvularcula sp. IMCC14364]
MENDTIFALSSGAGKAGVAVFRISGPGASGTLELFSGKKLPAREVSFSRLTDPKSTKLIDSGIVFWFAGPASFTGEDMAEMQVHGSRAVIDEMMRALSGSGLRPAEPGEFTMRAFRNGKIDLAQSEALADLIDAETIHQKQQALQQVDGRLSALAMNWYQQLLGCLAPLEAGIDFPDEEDVPVDIENTAVPVIRKFIQELSFYLEEGKKARRVREGVSVVLIGAPNAGKSSLLNYLAGSEVAIVSDIPGTTRDLIEVRLDIKGVPVSMVDTAGLRSQSADRIEEEGMRRARQRAANADLRICLIDGSVENQLRLSILRDLGPGDVVLITKADLASASDIGCNIEHHKHFAISTKTGDGVKPFILHLEAVIAELCGSIEEPRLTRARHIHAVQEARQSLQRSLNYVVEQPELAAEDVRLAMRHLGSITGMVDVEDVLGEIFSSFCIGK